VKRIQLEGLAPLAAAALAAVMPLFAHAAETLYAASVRSGVNTGSSTIAGSLYRINPSTGGIKLIGPIRVDGTVPIGVTGVADHPLTRVVYGITAESSPNHPRSLVTIDVDSGAAKLVGDVGAAGTDIAFAPDGNLFVWLRQTSQLGAVDLATGVARPIGSPGPPSETGGLTIGANGRAYLAATGATGSLDTIDTNTGAITKGPQLTGAPFGGINSLTLAPGGSILAVNTNLGSPANTVLVRIDVASGKVTQIGPLPNDTDALAFVERPWKLEDLLSSRRALTLIAALVVAGFVVAFFLGTRRRQR
jgi:hypothetical protein